MPFGDKMAAAPLVQFLVLGVNPLYCACRRVSGPDQDLPQL